MCFVAVNIILVFVGVTEPMNSGIWIFRNVISCFTFTLFYIFLPRDLFFMCRICIADEAGVLRKRNEINLCSCQCVDNTRLFYTFFFFTSVIPCYCRIFDWIRFTRPNGRMGMDRVSYTGNIYMCGPSQHWRVDMQKDRIYVLPRGLKNFLSYWAVMLLFLVLSGWQMHRCLAYVQIGILLFCSVKKTVDLLEYSPPLLEVD